MKKILVTMTVLPVLVVSVTSFITAKRTRAKRELATEECNVYKSRLGAKIEIESEKTRLEAAGLDVDILKTPNGNDIMWMSSSKLAHEQIDCKIEVTSRMISSVQ